MYTIPTRKRGVGRMLGRVESKERAVKGCRSRRERKLRWAETVKGGMN